MCWIVTNSQFLSGVHNKVFLVILRVKLNEFPEALQFIIKNICSDLFNLFRVLIRLVLKHESRSFRVK